MVFGGARQERIALNEDTLWSGAPREWNNPDAKAHLPIIRKLVMDDADYQSADQECRKMQGSYTQAFEPLGDLLLEFDHGDQVRSYRRELDLERAISSVNYEVNGCRYTREVFASHPAQLLIVRLSCGKPRALNFTVRLTSQLRGGLQDVRHLFRNKCQLR